MSSRKSPHHKNEQVMERQIVQPIIQHVNKESVFGNPSRVSPVVAGPIIYSKLQEKKDCK